MTKTIKSVLAACIVFAMAAPTDAGAGTFMFLGRNTFANMFGTNGTGLTLSLDAFQAATFAAAGTPSPGALVVGTNYTQAQCWFGFGSTNSFQFSSPDAKRVAASGAVTMNWFEFCTTFASFTETLTFSASWSALQDLTARRKGASRSEYGSVVNDSSYDETVAAATVAGGYLVSPAFGTVSPGGGHVGVAREHAVQINMP